MFARPSGSTIRLTIEQPSMKPEIKSSVPGKTITSSMTWYASGKSSGTATMSPRRVTDRMDEHPTKAVPAARIETQPQSNGDAPQFLEYTNVRTCSEPSSPTVTVFHAFFPLIRPFCTPSR